MEAIQLLYIKYVLHWNMSRKLYIYKIDPTLIFKMFTNNTKQAVCTNTVIYSFHSSGMFCAIQACNRYCAMRSSMCNVRFKKTLESKKS